MKEEDIIKNVTDFLIERGWEIKGKTRVRGKYPDIIAVKDDKITMVEAKGEMGDIIRGIGQAIHYRYGANFVYLAIPSKLLSKTLTQTLRGIGLGLLVVNDEIETILKPKETKPLNSIRKRIYKISEERKKERIAPSTKILVEISGRRNIIEIFLKYPQRRFTIRELSELAKTSYATTWRFIQKLDKAGIILTEKIGASISCKLNTQTPFIREIEKLLEIETSPQRRAAREFANEIKKVREIRRVILFGSVARAEEKLTSDIDIAVFVAQKDQKIESKIVRTADKILKRSKMKIVPILLTREELKENKQFAKELEKGVVLYERD
jgi:predicted nucleotidyltransferase